MGMMGLDQYLMKTFSGQAGIMEGVPAHSQGMVLDNPQGLSQPKPFQDSLLDAGNVECLQSTRSTKQDCGVSFIKSLRGIKLPEVSFLDVLPSCQMPPPGKC